MGAVYFYHMTRTPLEATLPMLLAKSREAGWRVYVKGSDAERLRWLDEKLWLGDEAGFLPHGLEGGDWDADQPILLGQGAPGTHDCVMSIDGAELSAETVKQAARACVLFDGSDEAAVTVARGQWSRLTGAGLAAQYWAQEGPRWVKKAEKAASDAAPADPG